MKLFKKNIKKVITKFLKKKPNTNLSDEFSNKWRRLDGGVKECMLETVQITGVYETIGDIEVSIRNKEKGAYLRFGDGDIMLKNGLSEMMHDANTNLAIEMNEAFCVNEGKIHKALAIHSKQFGFDKEMNIGMHLVSNEIAINFLSSTYHYFIGQKIYSPVALHYLSVFDVEKCIEFLKFIKATNPIFVGNEEIKPELINKLFGNEFIKTPSQNSYQEIDRIELELTGSLAKYNGQFKVVVVAMGCSGRVLQKRILKKGYNVYLFDFGSLLDAFNGMQTRTWISMTGANNLQKMLKNLD